MLTLSKLPRFVFIDEQQERAMDLASCGAQIRAIAKHVTHSFPEGNTVGLIFPSGPELVLAWLGVVASGRVPLILQYPNEKISNAYWSASIHDTVARCELDGLMTDSRLQGHDLHRIVSSCTMPTIDWTLSEPSDLRFPETGQILQMSSGTTGFKKPIAFTFDALKQHAACYGNFLEINAQDRMISWLPLYHDMGFIACFILPLLRGIPVVMMDPMTWVRQPDRLFKAIEDHAATLCYMPNFGFEVMAKNACRHHLDSMRQWICCSEPAYADTLEKFCRVTSTAPEKVSTCYGMAENVFAVTQSQGLEIVEEDGIRRVSCGKPVPHTEIKIVHGQVWVRSPYSLSRYCGGEELRDTDGFYPTGDLGFFSSASLVITGRCQDMANVGGKKYLLNDLDNIMHHVLPQWAGRQAAIAVHDEASGTDKILFLIEAEDFWMRQKKSDAAQKLSDATGIEWMEVHFVPPSFLTKTSSGKINRRQTLADWQAVNLQRHTRETSSAEGDALQQQLHQLFPALEDNLPLFDQVDSLGRVLARIACEEHGVAWSPTLTLGSLHAVKPVEQKRKKTFRIVAMVDGWRLGFEAPTPHLNMHFLEAIENIVGCPVEFEHICVPPVPVLFSDLIFHEYFLPKKPDAAYRPVAMLLEKIRTASLLLVDDEDNFRLPMISVYPILDHRFTMGPDTDLLGHRLQRYTVNHHLLPHRALPGAYITPQMVNLSIRNLADYLEIPIFRLAFHAEYLPFSKDWDFCAHRRFTTDEDKKTMVDWIPQFEKSLLRFIEKNLNHCPIREGDAVNRYLFFDSPHFCSFQMNRMAIDFVTRIYDSFCLVGLPGSIPYIEERLKLLGKPYFYSTQMVPERNDYQCLLLTGGIGGEMPNTGKPTFDFMHSRREGEGGSAPYNVPPEIAYACPPLVFCDESIYRSLRGKYMPPFGNQLYNMELQQKIAQQKVAATHSAPSPRG